MVKLTWSVRGVDVVEGEEELVVKGAGVLVVACITVVVMLDEVVADELAAGDVEVCCRVLVVMSVASVAVNSSRE